MSSDVAPKTRREFLTLCEWSIAIVATLVVVCFHVLRIRYAGPLWRDEAAAVTLARMPIRELLASFQFEAFPLLFPLLVRGYTAVAGTGVLALRTFGFLVGAIGLASLWLNARSIRRDVPLVSLALFGFMPAVFIWGDSMRGYGLGYAFIVLAFFAFERVVREPSPRAVGFATVAAILSVQCLLANAVLIGTMVLSAAAVKGWKGQWRGAAVIIGIGGAAAVSVAPYLPSYWSAKAWNVVFRSDVELGWLLTRLISATGGPGPGWIWALFFAGALIGVLWLTGRPEVPVENKQSGLFCVLTSLLAVIAYLGFLKVLSYPTHDWYYLALLALGAAALDKMASLLTMSLKWVRIVRLLLPAALVCVQMGSLLQVTRVRMTNMDVVTAELSRRAQPEDMVIVMPWYFGVSFQWHDPGMVPWTTLPAITDLRTHRYDLFKERMQAAEPIADVLTRAGETLKNGHRVWIVGQPVFPGANQPPPTLAPAPHDSAGWSEAAYTSVWLMQCGYFLQTHALDGEPIGLPDAGVINPFETAQLVRVDGWQTNF